MVADVLGSRDAMMVHLNDNLEKALQSMVKQANKHRREVVFQVADKVFLKVRRHHQSTVFQRAYHKLSPKFYGPFLVEAWVGSLAYRLSLPSTSRIHPVFHVSQLRCVVGDHLVEAELPKSLELPVGPAFAPEEVLAWRHGCEQGEDMEQLLVKWVG